ncbi:hypothetical protein [Helicobacter cholecystus]|uniref:hypothetical protein n=1 Tax=Helicobacter cholecystus TaxID=45498 RepID=UPI002738E1E4|nr:hypothetical protein [Helicobacter cholecystus]
MKINNHSEYQTIRLVAQKTHHIKPEQSQMQNQKEVEQKPFADLKTFNAQVAQVQKFKRTLDQAKEQHQELLVMLDKNKSPELEKRIQNIELKITQMLKKSLMQGQEFESLTSLYRSLVQSYDHKDHNKIQALLHQAQNKLHDLLDCFENKISEIFSKDWIDFDSKKVKNEFFAKSHHDSKLSLECLL